MKPLYDALFEMMGADALPRLMERDGVEVAPLAYMRGRTLNDSFIILDEAQNTTPEQMKMFLTRLGFGSKAVVNGDVTQIDLPNGQTSGLVVVQDILRDIDGIEVSHLGARDVVRHKIVQDIVEAYRVFGEQRAAPMADDDQPPLILVDDRQSMAVDTEGLARPRDALVGEGPRTPSCRSRS